ncbi:MAG: hypothetical protein HYY34_04970 [Chloroflexi bacterium]|nr:hypothetical protein [Chloroflexota bacterium]
MAIIRPISDHCLIDKPTHMLAFSRRYPLVGQLSRALYQFDPKMHFRGPTGALWRALGVARSTKNPNVCTL